MNVTAASGKELCTVIKPDYGMAAEVNAGMRLSIGEVGQRSVLLVKRDPFVIAVDDDDYVLGHDHAWSMLEIIVGGAFSLDEQ